MEISCWKSENRQAVYRTLALEPRAEKNYRNANLQGYLSQQESEARDVVRTGLVTGLTHRHNQTASKLSVYTKGDAPCWQPQTSTEDRLIAKLRHILTSPGKGLTQIMVIAHKKVLYKTALVTSQVLCRETQAQ